VGGVIAILTDFGTRDGFVGAMKGVILSISPEAKMVDISHEVEPFDVLGGGMLLKAHYSYFPKGTVFLCVVDPGVGSQRLPLAVKGDDYYFVGPHNGLFDLTLRELRDVRAFRIENFTLPRVNQTFHGRDVFAPVAAHLSKGIPIQEVGSPVDYNFCLEWEEPKEGGDILWGKVVYFDRFGNCITNIPCGQYEYGVFRGERLRVVSYFLQAQEGKPALVCGSFGFMELFLPMENAKERLKVQKGERVGVKILKNVR